MQVKKLRKILTREKLDQSPSGISCTFVKICDKWGLKLYYSEKDRDRNYEWQKKAAELGLGPDLGGKLDGICPQYKFGYVTEVVDVYENAYEDFCEWCQGNYDDISEDEIDDFDYRDWLDGVICELIDGLQSIGFDTTDLHQDNIGIKNGEFVCIDFGQDNIY